MKNKKFSEPVNVFDEKTVDEFELKYYNSDIHRASFVLPTSNRKVIILF